MKKGNREIKMSAPRGFKCAATVCLIITFACGVCQGQEKKNVNQESAGVCQILKNYGTFETSSIEGWDTFGGVEMKTVDRGDGKGKCLSVMAKDVKYISCGISINPLVAWNPIKDCIVSLEAKGGDTKLFGYGIYMQILAADMDNESSQYRFVMFLACAGDKEYECMSPKPPSGWNLKGVSFMGKSHQMEDIIKPDDRTYTCFAGRYPEVRFQMAPWLLNRQSWTEMKFNLKDAFSAANAPKHLRSLVIKELKVVNYVLNETSWMLDNIRIEGDGISSIPLK